MSLGSLHSALADYNFYDLYLQFCLLRWQSRRLSHLVIRDQTCERLIERLKVPVLVSGGVTDSISRLLFILFEENFKESKGRCP